MSKLPLSHLTVLFLALLLSRPLAAADPLDKALALAEPNAPEIEAFLQESAENHGEFGATAARFLVANMPESDLMSLSADYLNQNLALALQSRQQFPWSATIPDQIFLNHVLPYAVLDEPRDPWRAEILALAAPMVAEATSITEAVQILNRDFFNKINVHYSTARERANQSAHESIALSKASCSGLSILLVNACRAVGIPARAVGTPLWSDKRGNHTWVEIWDGGWHFTGADEYTAEGLDRGWFVEDASKASNDSWEHTIYATTWQRNGQHFPLVWDLDSRSVAATDVTHRYAKTTGRDAAPDAATLFLRLRDTDGGKRISAPFEIRDARAHTVATDHTRAAPADLNDMPSASLPSGKAHLIRFWHHGEAREFQLPPLSAETTTLDLVWDELPPVPEAIIATERWLALPKAERRAAIPDITYTREEAERAVALLWNRLNTENAPARALELSEGLVKAAGKTMPILVETFGETPPDGRSLWISLHGGGGTTPAINDQQWKNQAKLYQPEEGIYIAPRAPTNNWNLWHEPHIDALLDRLIENAVLTMNVNPNRVFLLGYSAGGDGIYQIAPRMADRWAAAAMMAGHPNDASPRSLRNLPFAIFMGAEDAAYDRNAVAAEWSEKLARLHEADPTGYIHRATIYDGLGHWMNHRDAEALPWMAKFTRDPWPSKVVWHQDDVLHHRFYWLTLPEGTAHANQSITAIVKGQTIMLETKNVSKLILRLSDNLLDLDRPIQVTHAEKPIFQGRVPRTLTAISHSLQQRLDPTSAATTELPLSLGPDQIDK